MSEQPSSRTTQPLLRPDEPSDDGACKRWHAPKFMMTSLNETNASASTSGEDIGLSPS